ncbi:hypothetical protein [Bacillus chungangensis]|uniref:Uncharacterized protein n=1 Tax=Bacillus chungangensis TaxID=587633 RepID=A0ABT9WML2_9BACI|nr:hypothetical protein [Bacillus chungangensis]MDQ0174451.1 hypothetical protein [Bacillus chungangensis]
MEKKVRTLHEMIKSNFPDAVAVRIFVNSEGIEVSPEYRTNADGYSMQKINGHWINRNN